jgi:hypothetical protein
LVLSCKKELLFEKRSKNFCYFAVLATFVFTVHYPALGAYFAADDFLWLAHGAWEDAGRAFAGSWGLGTAYRPLARLSFVADARAFGETAWPWHFENLLLHVLAAFLVAALARQAGLRRIDAALAGLLFAAVPVAWENADWISGRTGLFMVVFGLACALCWMKWLRGQAYWLAAAAVAEAAGLLCYEPASVIPLALLAISPSLARQGLSWRRISAGLAVLGLVVAVFWAIRATLLGTVFLAVDVRAAQTLPGMARNLAGLMLHGWSDFGALGFCGAVGVLTVGLANSRTRRHVAALLAAAFLLYMPFWLVAGVTERFFYAAAAPLALALVVAGTAWRGLRPVLAVLVVLFALRSHAQAEGVRDAGQLNRALLTQIAALPADGRALVFDAVPTHLGAYYLLWGAFDIAAVQARAAPGIAARSETVLDNPTLLRKVLAGPTRFMSYDAASGRLTDLPRATWLARHPAAMAR